MQRDAIARLVSSQRAYFATGQTLPVSARLSALKRLRNALRDNRERLALALRRDLGKSEFEGYMCEIGLAVSEITYLIRHLRSFARERTVATPLPQFPSRSYVKPSPYGVTLIMSPWNYPLLLTVTPLADALAAGNTAVVKPSAYSPATSELLAEILGRLFPSEYVAVVSGGREENQYLLEEKFDYIFFTGSKSVGQLVLEKAARHLTPVTLELGGKSPCIVHRSADLPVAARRIVFGKFLNCGQTCVAPDYILCDPAVKDRLIACLCAEVRRQFGEKPLENGDYGNIVSRKHFDRICGLMDPEKTILGGGADEKTLRIEPTILDNVTFDDPVMKEEIFGPILPVLTFDSEEEIVSIVNGNDKPLALYVFATDRRFLSHITSRCSYGGGCVNDVVIHLATSNMGFGGVGESGMGSYHGKDGFDTFTHYKSIVHKKNWLDLPMRYQPYRPFYRQLIEFFLR